MADITLVNPVFPSNTTIPPYGLLYLAAVLEEKGYTVDVRDYQIYECPDSWEYSNFLEFLKGSSSIIGAATYSFNLPFLMKAFTELKKEDPEKTILLGGIGATGVHTELMNNFSCIDVVVRGEAEKTLPQLLTALENNASLDAVCGITYRSKGIHVTPPQSRITNLDNLPHPAFQKIESKLDLRENGAPSMGVG